MAGPIVSHETLEEEDLIQSAHQPPVAGVVLIFCVARPVLHAFPLRDGAIELGRGEVAGFTIDDERCSRKHVRVELRGGVWTVRDLDSRNGSFVDGNRVDELRAPAPRVLRIGRTLFLFDRDVRRFLRGAVEVGDHGVIGPTLRAAWSEIGQAADAGDTLLITGESGTGKELAARAFHEAGPRAGGPFIGVNCAAIPEGVAERLLFGARRGAYSGATADADGYLQAADGGTLFLDEVAELELPVQAKLLRVLETREVLALGAARARPVDVRVCAATCKDVHRQVASGKFREDLYFRIGRPEVHLPPLRQRAEEIPWHIRNELAKVGADLVPQAALVETCVSRAWPGNVRELLGEVRRAGHAALAEGRKNVEARDLGPRAGLGVGTAPATSVTAPVTGVTAATPAPAPAPTGGTPDRPTIEAALRRENGNVTRAARALGMHRNQLRRWLTKNEVDPTTFGASDDDETSDAS